MFGRGGDSMPLVEADECLCDAEQLGLSLGYESLDPIGREAFVNHHYLSGEGREAAAGRVIRAWAAEINPNRRSLLSSYEKPSPLY
jgi:hypothetical protein